MKALHLVMPPTSTPNQVAKLKKVLTEAMGMMASEALSGTEVDVYVDEGDTSPNLLTGKGLHTEDKEFISSLVSKLLNINTFTLINEPTERLARYLVPDWCGNLNPKRFIDVPACMIDFAA